MLTYAVCRCFLIAACFTITLEAIEKLVGVGPYGTRNTQDLESNAFNIILLGCVGLGMYVYVKGKMLF